MADIVVIRKYFRYVVGGCLLLVAVYKVVATNATVADTQVLISGLLGLYFMIDASLGMGSAGGGGTPTSAP